MLQQFSFDVIYCRGSENIVADFLSRNPDDKYHAEVNDELLIATSNKYFLPENEITEISALLILALNSNEVSLKSIVKNLSEKQHKDEKMQRIFTLIENNSIENYQVYLKILFHKESTQDNRHIVIPSYIKK